MWHRPGTILYFLSCIFFSMYFHSGLPLLMRKKHINCKKKFTYRNEAFDPPTFLLEVLSLQESISFFRINKHSLNVEINWWWLRIQRDVNELFRILLACLIFLRVLGDFCKLSPSSPGTFRVSLLLEFWRWLASSLSLVLDFLSHTLNGR